jgi:hypothetical protein
MMKLTYRAINRKLRNHSDQDRLLKFVDNKKNVEKAAEGSMNKRLEVLERASLRKKPA